MSQSAANTTSENTPLTTMENDELHNAIVKEPNFNNRKNWDDDGSEDSDGEDDKVSSKKKKKNAKIQALVLASCLCIFVAMIIAGSWLAAAGAPNATSAQLAGYALLTIAAVLLLFCMLICCAACVSVSSPLDVIDRKH